MPGRILSYRALNQRQAKMNIKHIFTAVIVCAGNGSRMNSTIKKPYMDLYGEMIMIRTIRAFENNPMIDHIVVVVPAGETQKVLKLCLSKGFRKISAVTEGGKERYISVYNGISEVPADTNFLLVHDGARPLVSQELIYSCCTNVQAVNACIVAVPVRDTIKKATKQLNVSETLKRDELWAVQTPQAFSFHLIRDAYKELFRTIEEYGPSLTEITDDSVIVENMTNTRVKIIPGDEINIKITTPSDLILAEALLKNMKG